MAALVLMVIVGLFFYFVYKKFPDYVKKQEEKRILLQQKIESKIRALNLKEKLRKLKRR